MTASGAIQSTDVRSTDVQSTDAVLADDQHAIWQRLFAAKRADEYAQAWLSVLSLQLSGVQTAAILMPGVEAQTFIPLAVWPAPSEDMAELVEVVSRALTQRRTVVQAVSAPQSGLLHMAYPVFAGQRVAAVVALKMQGEAADMSAALRVLHWGSAWLTHLLSQHDHDQALLARDRLSIVLESLAMVLRQGRFQQVLFSLVNDLRQRFSCARVALGLVQGHRVTLAALSDAAVFEKHAPLVKAYETAMEETLDAGGAQQFPALTAESGVVPDLPGHGALLQESGAGSVLSLPLMQGLHCHGILLMERSAAEGFAAHERELLSTLSSLLTPAMLHRQDADRPSWKRLWHEIGQVLRRLFGPRHLIWKALASLLLLSTLLLAFVETDYRVSAKTVIEGEVQRVVAVPFEGFIAQSHARAGDTVKKGQLLASLDDRELRVEQARWRSEYQQYANRLREAMANHDLAAVQSMGAQVRQAEAQLQLATDKIAHASLLAPFDGVVISGDVSQQIGSPVENGKTLFEVAPLDRYRVILQVDEREVRHLRQGQKGWLVIAGIASEAMPFTVVRLTSVATAEDGKNFFRVEARLAAPPGNLRPGMEGVGKVLVGERSLWWTLTHSFADWLRLTLWTWLPW